MQAISKGLGRRLVANAMANLAGQSLLLLLTFFSTPYIIRHFGAARFGALMLVLTYVEAFGLLELGINATLVKYMAELLEQRRVQDVHAYFGTALTLYLAGGMLIAGLVALSSQWVIANFMNIGEELQQHVVHAFWIASVAFLFRFVSQPASGIPIAAQRFDIANYVSVGSEIIRVLGSVAVVYFGYLLQGVLVVILVANLFSCAAYFIIAQRLIPGLSLWPRFSSGHLRSLFHFSKFILIANVSGRAVSYADNLMIGYFLPVVAVGFYTIPYGVCKRLSAFVQNLAVVVFPAASSLSATAQPQQLEELYLRGSKMVAAAVSFPALALCLFSSEFLRYWIGPEFAQQGALAMRLLTLGFLLSCLGHIPFLFLQGTGYPQIAARFAGGQAVLIVILFWIFIPRFGIAGAAAGFLIAQSIVMPWMTHCCNRLLQIGWTRVLVTTYASVVPTSVLASLACLALRSWVSSLFSLAVVVAVGLVVYLAMVVAIVFDGKERATCWQFVSARSFSVASRREPKKV